MINYLRSEWYQLTHRKGPYAWMLVAALGSASIIVAPLIFAHYNESFALEWFGPFAVEVLLDIYTTFINSTAPFLTIGICATAFNNELKNRTFVNTTSAGFSRTQIFFAKFISSLVLCAICLFIANVTFTVLGLIFYPNSFDVYINHLFVDFFLGHLVYFTMYVALYTVVNFISGTGVAVTIVIFAQIVTESLLAIFANFSDTVATIRPYVFTELNPQNPLIVDNMNITNLVILAYIILFLGFGIWYFNHKEIR